MTAPVTLQQLDTGITALEAATAGLLNENNTLQATCASQAAVIAAGQDHAVELNRVNALTTSVNAAVATLQSINTQIQAL